MTFAAPLFLLAALAAAIPVVLHMINRQQAKELPFSTLRFLQISVQKTRRRKRIHDVLADGAAGGRAAADRRRAGPARRDQSRRAVGRSRSRPWS